MPSLNVDPVFPFVSGSGTLRTLTFDVYGSVEDYEIDDQETKYMGAFDAAASFAAVEADKESQQRKRMRTMATNQAGADGSGTVGDTASTDTASVFTSEAILPLALDDCNSWIGTLPLLGSPSCVIDVPKSKLP